MNIADRHKTDISAVKWQDATPAAAAGALTSASDVQKTQHSFDDSYQLQQR